MPFITVVLRNGIITLTAGTLGIVCSVGRCVRLVDGEGEVSHCRWVSGYGVGVLNWEHFTTCLLEVLDLSQRS